MATTNRMSGIIQSTGLPNPYWKISIVNAIVLRPLPVPQPDRLAFLYNSYPRAGVAVAGSAVPDYYDCLEEKGLFEEVALFRSRGQTIGAGGNAERRTMMTMTPSLFRILQVKPLMGRAFTEEDAEETAEGGASAAEE